MEDGNQQNAMNKLIRKSFKEKQPRKKKIKIVELIENNYITYNFNIHDNELRERYNILRQLGEKKRKNKATITN